VIIADYLTPSLFLAYKDTLQQVVHFQDATYERFLANYVYV